MSFSYERDTPIGTVRLLSGDVEVTANPDARLEDEDILRIIEITCGTRNPGDAALQRAAAEACDVLAAKFDRKAEGSTGPNRIVPSGRAQGLRATANRLRARAAQGAAIYVGGTSLAEKEAVAADTDRPQPAFTAGMLDHPEA